MYHSHTHKRAELLFNEGYTVNLETGEVFDPAGQPAPIAGTHRLRVEVTIRSYTHRVHVHKLIAYAAYGAIAFQPGYTVHHVNGNRYDNRARNLRVMSIEAHAALHGYTPKAASD